MKPAALGFRAHSGWTAMVALCVEDGKPCVLLRERPRLVETFTYEFRQPYHTAEKLPLERARDFVERSESEARTLADKAVEQAQKEIRNQGYKVMRCGLLLASTKPLPALERILASHALIHSADGALFRAALIHASRRLKLQVSAIRERELFANAGQVLKMEKQLLLKRLTALGKGMGAPWSQDEKLAALVAWITLVSPAK